jgi:hypothetical protein
MRNTLLAEGFCEGVTQAGQLLPQLAGATPPVGQGPLCRGDGGLHRGHLQIGG